MGDNESELGIDNITVEQQDREDTISFEENGTVSDSMDNPPECSYYLHDEYHQSTPTNNGQFANFVPPGNIINQCLSDHYSSTTGMTFVYFRGHQKIGVIADSTEDVLRSAVMISDSNNAIDSSNSLPNICRHRVPIVPFTYIDDSNGCSRLLMADGNKIISDKKTVVNIHAKNCETFFKGVERSSSELGMKINQAKTQLLCISAHGNDTKAYIRLDNEKKMSEDSLKICGYTFSSKPDVSAQLETIERKFNERVWVLRNLRRSGFSRDDLKTTYVSLIRPVFDFTSVVYHSLMNIEQGKHLERLQKRALTIITGSKRSNYEKMLEEVGLTSLYDRRLQLIDNFLDKCLHHPLHSGKWFPLKERNNYNTRHEEKYLETKCNTERCRSNPLNFFRRRLNDRAKTN